MRFNRLLIFAIAIIFLLSLNFAFAVDENATQTVSESDDAGVELQNNLEDISADNSEDVFSALDDSGAISIADDKTIVMGKVTKRFNGAIQYSASFYDRDGNPLKNTKVLFELDDYNDYQPTTDSNGVALLTILINNGNHKIGAFNPVSGYIAYDNIKVFDVVTGGKNIKMYYDDGNTYKVRVFDDNGNPVKAGQKVTFKIGNKKYTKSTDKNGYAKLKITSKPGLYYIYATYKDFTVSNTLLVRNVIKANTGSLGKGLSKIFKVKINYLGKNKKNKLIKVKFNKKTYKAKTNKKGVALFKIKSPNKLGKYKLVAIYKQCKVSYEYSQYRTG